MNQDFHFSDHETPSLAVYTKAIKNTEPLTTEEEHELGRRIQMGDIEARNKLIEANQKFVFQCVSDFSNWTVPNEELVSAARMGLVEAAIRYNPSFDGRFISYAVHYIKEYIRQAVAEYDGTISVPSTLRKMARCGAPSVNDELDYDQILEEEDKKKSMPFPNGIYRNSLDDTSEELDDSRPLIEKIAAGADEVALESARREADEHIRTFLSNHLCQMEVDVLMNYANKKADNLSIIDLAHEYHQPLEHMTKYVNNLLEKVDRLQLWDIYRKKAA